MEESNVGGDSVFVAVEELVGEVGTKVGLGNGPESGADQVGFGLSKGNRILNPLLLLLLRMLRYSHVFHSLYLKTTTSFY